MSAKPEWIWYFDVISPFAYLQWQRLRVLDEVELKPRPILLGVLLTHLQQRGPAEIPEKRVFTYRMVLWRAKQLGLSLRFPPSHPFNSISALRLILAAGTSFQAVDSVMNAIWRDGRALDQPEVIADLGRSLGLDDPAAALADSAVKTALRTNTEEAISAGVFGVPTVRVGSDVYWGEDATELALAATRDPQMLASEPYSALAQIPVSARRREV